MTNAAPPTPRTATPRRVLAPTPREIAIAAAGIARRLPATPVVPCPALGPGAMLKLETSQPTGAFKVRGALTALGALPPGSAVVTASAGNHALGVAYASEALGVPAAVVLPETASPAKLAELARRPVRLVRHGATYDAAERHAMARAREEGATFVSAYNDRSVIAGQASIAVELLGQVPRRPLTIVCPIGGGGLVSGVALWAAHAGGGAVRVVGVEGAGAPAMRAALDAGRRVDVPVRPTVADGLGGNLEEGSVTIDVVRRLVDDVVVVEEEEITAAIRLLAERHGLVVEGAGAAAAAAVLAGRVPYEGAIVALVTGRNISLDVLSRVLGRARRAA
ncbi:MAG: threonine dehydratase [Miltoncostaeaceae bacterium]|nr:threonine dehydratase [Miltoncostaeaceae bacterium]